MINDHDRTSNALGSEIMQKLQSLRFCIVGCGGTGANFAEMLVRSGATLFTLIDGRCVALTELNRVSAYTQADIGKPKVTALKERLLAICPDASVDTFQDSFRASENILPEYRLGQEVRDAVYDADVVFIATDTTTSRTDIEELCRSKTPNMYLSCGVYVDRAAGDYYFVCNWRPSTPKELPIDDGYGPENASYAAIVHEATSMAFSMLLNHLSQSDGKFRSYLRRYDRHFLPVETVINEISSNNIPLNGDDLGNADRER